MVAEPTDLDIGTAHRGFVGLEVTVTGRAAHGSRPERGVDAIVRMGRVLVGLEELDRSCRRRHRTRSSAPAPLTRL